MLLFKLSSKFAISAMALAFDLSNAIETIATKGERELQLVKNCDNCCVGANACQYTGCCGGSAEVSENSCTSSLSCQHAGASNQWSPNSYIFIDEGSCTGEQSCKYAANSWSWKRGYAVIGRNSCLLDSCMGLAQGGWAIIGDGSCTSTRACVRAGQEAFAEIGNDSCIGGQNVCEYSGRDGNCKIGNGSCHGNRACFKTGTNTTVTIGDGSCKGSEACEDMGVPRIGQKIHIGSNSCNCPGCCQCLKGMNKDPILVKDGTCNSRGTNQDQCCNTDGTINNMYDFDPVGIATMDTFKELPDGSFNLEKGTSNLVKVNFNVQDTQAGTTYSVATDQASATELYFTTNAYKNACTNNNQVAENLLEWVDIELSIEDDNTTVVAKMTNILDVPLEEDVLRFCFVLRMMLKVPVNGATDVLFDGVALTFVLSLSHLEDGEMVIEFTTSDASTIDKEIELTSGDEGVYSKNYSLYFGSPTLIDDDGSYAFGDVIEIQSTIEYTGGNDYFAYTISDITLYKEDKTTLLDANPVKPTSVVEDVSGTPTAIVKLQIPLKVFQLNLEKIVVKYTITYEEKNSARHLLSTIDSKRILKDGSSMHNETDDPSTIESGTSETEVTITLKPLTQEDLEAAGIVTDEQMIANGLDPNDYPKNDSSEISVAKDDLPETSSTAMVNVPKYLIAAMIATATFLG